MKIIVAITTVVSLLQEDVDSTTIPVLDMERGTMVLREDIKAIATTIPMIETARSIMITDSVLVAEIIRIAENSRTTVDTVNPREDRLELRIRSPNEHLVIGFRRNVMSGK